MSEHLPVKENRLPNIFFSYPSSLLALAFCFCSLVLSYFTYHSLKESQHADEQRYQVSLLVAQLNQSSDQLTLMARGYAVTGEKKYLDFYNEIVAIRVGEEFRPQFYHRVYWDFMLLDGSLSPFPKGEKASFEQLMEELELPDDEVALLLQAKAASTELSMTEYQAFDEIANGLNNAQRYLGSDARERAITLLYNSGYLFSKAKIKQFINDFYDLHEPRAEKNIQSKETQYSIFSIITFISFLLSILFLLYNLYIQSKNKETFVKTLKSEVASRTLELLEKQKQLKETINEMDKTKHQLVENEKMASLGTLVGGIAHEVNTPLGISITIGSCMQDAVMVLSRNVDSGKLKRSDLDSYCEETTESCVLLLANLNRAAELIESFKQVAIDQTSDEMRAIKISAYIDEVLRSLHPFTKKSDVTFTVHAPEDEPTLQSYPGALAQIVTNLVMNMLIHAFDNGQRTGQVNFTIAVEQDNILMTVCDDGAGMPSEVKNKIFEPFYTTQRGNGGSGLGMSIVYNLVVHKLQGSITCQSILDEGTTFSIIFPAQVKAASIT